MRLQRIIIGVEVTDNDVLVGQEVSVLEWISRCHVSGYTRLVNSSITFDYVARIGDPRGFTDSLPQDAELFTHDNEG